MKKDSFVLYIPISAINEIDNIKELEKGDNEFDEKLDNTNN